MGAKTIPTDKFVRWLLSLGLIEVRTSSSHTFYNYPERHPNRLSRNVCVRLNYKDIPILHIHTNLKTLNISKSDFERQIKEF